MKLEDFLRKQKLLTRFKRYCNDPDVLQSTSRKAIVHAFSFSSTQEGADFWLAVSTHWKEHHILSLRDFLVVEDYLAEFLHYSGLGEGDLGAWEENYGPLAITNAFPFSNTDEGYILWAKIQHRWEDACNPS